MSIASRRDNPASIRPRAPISARPAADSLPRCPLRHSAICCHYPFCPSFSTEIIWEIHISVFLHWIKWDSHTYEKTWQGGSKVQGLFHLDRALQAFFHARELELGEVNSHLIPLYPGSFRYPLPFDFFSR
jgi:hypothetical protein